MLMAQHPDIATIGELKATSMGDVSRYTCSCGALIGECAFWSKVTTKMHQAGLPFSVNEFGTHFCSNNSLHNKILCAQLRGGGFERLRRLCIRLVPGLNKTFQRILQSNETFIDIACDEQNARYFIDGSKDPQRLLYFLESGRWHIKVIRISPDGRAPSLSSMDSSNTPFSSWSCSWASTMLN
jgi:hypothetical protein